jgi:hypothetical protein
VIVVAVVESNSLVELRLFVGLEDYYYYYYYYYCFLSSEFVAVVAAANAQIAVDVPAVEAG